MWWKLAKFLIVLLFLAAIFVSYGYLFFWYYFKYKVDDLPDVLALRNYDFNLSTVVRDDEGKIIDKFAIDDRIFTPFKDIPDTVIKAVTAAEDKNFWSERLIPGIDQTGIVRAAWKNLMAGKIVEGGSTITQQVGKNIWLSNDRTFSRKFKEVRLAYRMEKELSKELIFETYINLAYFGHGKYGIVTASDFYFGKKPNELTIDEAAMLAGLIKWPYKFSPIEKPKAAQNRRNTVLERIYKNGFISAEELKELKSKPLGLNVKNAKVKAPYLSKFIMDELHRLGYEKVVNRGLDVQSSLNSDFQQITEAAFQKGLAAYDERHNKRLVLYNLSDYEITSLNDFISDSWNGELGLDSVVDGLVISVSSDAALVKIGNNELASMNIESFSKIRKDETDLTKLFKTGDIVSLKIVGIDAANNFKVEIVQPEVQGAVAVLDVETGAIKAIVGGRDFKSSEYNRAMQAERQAGSAIKVAVYGTLFEMYPDKDLNSIVLDQNPPNCYKTGNPKKPKWCPKNYEEKGLPKFMGPIPIKTAFARSRNVATVRVANEVGIKNIIKLARNLGITSELPPYLPTAIGAGDVKVIELANAYAAFFRDGVYKPYWFLKSIEDRKYGFKDFEPKESKQALSAEAANNVLEGMRWVVLAGTARSATKDLPFPIACKTGTTDKFTDAWTICGTPKYVVAVWVGFDRKAIPLVSRESPAKETGGFAVAPIVVDIMKEIYKNRPYDMFPEEMENRIKGIKKENTENKIEKEIKEGKNDEEKKE